MNNITINKNTIERKLYNNQPVITFKDIDLVHERPEGLGKQHKNVLRDLDKILETPDVASLIIPTTYKVIRKI